MNQIPTQHGQPRAERPGELRAAQKRHLATLAWKADDEPVSGREAWALASSIAPDEFYTQAWWPKLAGREAGKVRAVASRVRAARAEMRHKIMDDFAKEHPVERKRV